MTTMSRTIQIILCILALAGSSAHAMPMTIIDVDGPETGFESVNTFEAAGVGFSLAQDYTDVTIDSGAFCLRCDGLFLLIQGNIGPDTPLSSLVDAAFYTGGSADAIFTGLNLVADFYFLIFSISEGSGGWINTNDATITENGGARALIDIRSDDIERTFPAQSFFTAVFTNDLLYRVSGTAVGSVAVSEPATLWLMLLALTGVGLQRKRVC